MTYLTLKITTIDFYRHSDEETVSSQSIFHSGVCLNYLLVLAFLWLWVLVILTIR